MLLCFVVSRFIFSLLMSQSLPVARSQNSLNMLSWLNTSFVFLKMFCISVKRLSDNATRTMWTQDLLVLSGSLWTVTSGLCGALCVSVVPSPARFLSGLNHHAFCWQRAVVSDALCGSDERKMTGLSSILGWEGGEGCGIFSWNGAEGRVQCTWPPSGLEFQRSVQSGFLTFGGFTPEFCRHRFRTDVYRLKPWEIKHISISSSHLKGYWNAAFILNRCLMLTGVVLNKRNRVMSLFITSQLGSQTACVMTVNLKKTLS